MWSPAPSLTTAPLIVFSHTSGGHRLQASYLCEHLARQGYVVAAVDHAGSTATDRVARAARTEPWTPQETAALADTWIRDRVPDLSFVIDRFDRGGGVGLVGWSFGGWAVLAAPETDRRVGAVVALVPGGVSRPLPGIIAAPLTFEWGRDVPTLFIAAERDRFIPVEHVRELYDRIQGTKRMVVLQGAGHSHFGDEVDAADGPCSPDEARAFTRRMTLEHMDRYLRGRR